MTEKEVIIQRAQERKKIFFLAKKEKEVFIFNYYLSYLCLYQHIKKNNENPKNILPTIATINKVIKINLLIFLNLPYLYFN